MDCNSVHVKGISNLYSSSPHRMPTVSAAQALQNLKSSPARFISTGLDQLDCVLQNREPIASVSAKGEPRGGVSRGKVTEIYGPPGVGKTTLGIQLAASTLHAGEGVVWVDASHPVSGSRLSQILTTFRPTIPQAPASASSSEPPSLAYLLHNLTHFSTPTLAHLIALLLNPTSDHPASNTSLIVIDSFSTLLSDAFPRTMEAKATAWMPGAPSPSARKFPILQYLINALQKLATTRNIAIVVFSQCVTKMRQGSRAVLVPSINTTAWEQGIGCRAVIFRDWGWDDEDGHVVNNVRLVQVLKAEGINILEGRARLIGFTIGENGVSPLALPTFPTTQITNQAVVLINSHRATPTIPQKRKLAAANLEIPDSDEEDDEDYGWAEEDEEDIPPPPPQWQGSEDILVPPGGALEAEEQEAEEQGEQELEVENESGGGVTTHRYPKGEISDSEDELA